LYPPDEAQKSGRNEIVALNVTPQRRIARQVRQSGRLREGPRPENCVMSPVVAAALVPCGESRCNDGTVEADRELLETCKQGLRSHQSRHRLNQCGTRIAGH